MSSTNSSERGRVLQCHSKGDRRFSPFFCHLTAFGVRDSIEDFYQKSKVFVRPDGELVFPSGWREAKQLQKPPPHGEGLPLYEEFRLPNEMFVPIRYHIFGWYASLWLKYLDEHPALVEEAKTYDEYEDIFKGNFPLCQADCVRLYCKGGREALLGHCRGFFRWLKENPARV